MDQCRGEGTGEAAGLAGDKKSHGPAPKPLSCSSGDWKGIPLDARLLGRKLKARAASTRDEHWGKGAGPWQGRLEPAPLLHGVRNQLRTTSDLTRVCSAMSRAPARLAYCIRNEFRIEEDRPMACPLLRRQPLSLHPSLFPSARLAVLRRSVSLLETVLDIAPTTFRTLTPSLESSPSARTAALSCESSPGVAVAQKSVTPVRPAQFTSSQNFYGRNQTPGPIQTLQLLCSLFADTLAKFSCFLRLRPDTQRHCGAQNFEYTLDIHSGHC